MLEETQSLSDSPEKKIARIPSVERNGEQAKTPEQYLVPAGSTQRLYNLAKVLGVAQPAALQMSVSEAPCARAQEEATLRVEWAFTPRGHGRPCCWYAKAMASTSQ